MSLRLLQLTVFAAGAASLGVELAASRLLAPFFGTSLLIWANLIGVILIYLSIGYWLGGKWADRNPHPQTLFLIIAIAGVTVGILPYIAAPALALAIPALEQFNAELGLVSFLAVIILFAIPVTLLGCVPPFALRLAARDVKTVGSTGGGLYALSTIGSILGIYLAVFWLIPTLGTRLTFVTFAVLLMIVALIGFWQARAMLPAVAVVAFLFLVGGLALVNRTSAIKPLPNVVYETESPYNFIQVLQENKLWLLTVNEGQAFQSAYYPNTVQLGGYWDYFLLAPYLTSDQPPRSLLVIGLAAGTIAKQFALVYPQVKMDGIELDPEIVRVGRAYFDMHEPNLNVIVGDGRATLRQTTAHYDVIAMDAYRQPYLPFHLATVEYYQELKTHLTERGVLAVNAGRTPNDARLVDALTATLKQVFPTVIAVDYPSMTNTLLFASPQSISPDAFRARLAVLDDSDLRDIAALALPHIDLAQGDGTVFTDDKSSVENLIHSIIFDATVLSPKSSEEK